MSRTRYFDLRRQPGSPKPRANGTHSIAQWRAFSRKKVGSAMTTPKMELQLALLQARLDRERFELDQTQGVMEREIRDEFTDSFEGVMRVLRNEFDMMPAEMSPRFVGLTGSEIRNLWRDRQAQAYDNAVRAFTKRTGGRPNVKTMQPKRNVIEFQSAAGV
jgi:hypothetical protein